MAGAAELRVLGPVVVVGGNGPIPLAAKQVRLLAALVVAGGRACGVDELVESMWEGSPPASARKLIQVYVSQLRKALPPAIAITTVDGGYALPLEPGVLDAERFEQLLSESRLCSRRRQRGPCVLARRPRARPLARARLRRACIRGGGSRGKRAARGAAARCGGGAAGRSARARSARRAARRGSRVRRRDPVPRALARARDARAV